MSHAQTKLESLCTNLTIFNLNMAIKGLTQKLEGTTSLNASLP
jgi:hypothetical protein